MRPVVSTGCARGGEPGHLLERVSASSAKTAGRGAATAGRGSGSGGGRGTAEEVPSGEASSRWACSAGGGAAGRGGDQHAGGVPGGQAGPGAVTRRDAEGDGEPDGAGWRARRMISGCHAPASAAILLRFLGKQSGFARDGAMSRAGFAHVIGDGRAQLPRKRAQAARDGGAVSRAGFSSSQRRDRGMSRAGMVSRDQEGAP